MGFWIGGWSIINVEIQIRLSWLCCWTSFRWWVCQPSRFRRYELKRSGRGWTQRVYWRRRVLVFSVTHRWRAEYWCKYPSLSFREIGVDYSIGGEIVGVRYVGGYEFIESVNFSGCSVLIGHLSIKLWYVSWFVIYGEGLRLIYSLNIIENWQGVVCVLIRVYWSNRWSFAGRWFFLRAGWGREDILLVYWAVQWVGFGFERVLICWRWFCNRALVFLFIC